MEEKKQVTTAANAATTAVAQQAPQVKPVEVLKGVINAPSIQAQFKNALGEHKDAFVASLIDLFTGDKALQACDPKLLITEALRAATLRLPLNKALGFAYIVPFNKNEKTVTPEGREVWTSTPIPTFIPGYKGYIQLAMRTGQYKTINADLVHEGELSKTDKLTGEISFDGEKTSDKVVGYFCYFRLLNGFTKTLYVTVEDMAAYAKRYSPSVKKTTTVEALIEKANAAAVSKTVGWEGNFNDMALKTVIRRLLSKYGYLSVEMHSAISKDVEESDNDYQLRNDAISVSANSKTLNIDDAEAYEVVDVETGEVVTNTVAPKKASTRKAQAVSDEAPY
jgi:recombination protein RecT